MLTAFRTFAKSKWAVGLLVVLALALLVTGGTQMDVLTNLGRNTWFQRETAASDRPSSGASSTASVSRPSSRPDAP